MKPIDWLYADIAGRYGMDKDSWEDRMLFTLVHEKELEEMTENAKEPVLFAQAVRALRDVQEGKPTGHSAMYDCSASGMQLLSIMTGDVNGARISNVTGEERVDPYTEVYEWMLAQAGENAVLDRDDVKKAIMTALYGSEAEPEKLFQGRMLELFYEAMEANTPKCWELNNFLLDFLKQSEADTYNWVMPDNFHVACPVTETVYETVECLGQQVTVGRKVQQPHSRNRSLGANLTHSVESFITRELIRRCNVKHGQKKYIRSVLNGTAGSEPICKNSKEMATLLMGIHEMSGFLSARILNYVSPHTLSIIGEDLIHDLLESLPDSTFPIKTVHDCFSTHVNNSNDLLWQYRNLYMELNQSKMLEYILNQVLGMEVSLQIEPLKGIENSLYILS